MPEHHKRSFFRNVTPTQKKFLYPVLVPCMFGCIIILLILDYLHFDQGSIIYEYEFNKLKIIILIGCVVFSLMLFIIAFAMYFISSNIIGAYDRIVGELDKVLKGEAKGPLTVRKSDKLLKGLVDRVNALIERIP